MVEFMGKVLVTRKQLDRITSMLEVVGAREKILKAHKNGWEYEHNLCLNELSYEEMAKILENPINCLVADKEVIEHRKQQDGYNLFYSEIMDNVNNSLEKKIDNLIEDGEKINKNMQANEFDSDLPMYTEKEQEHLNSPFYKKVDEITGKVAVQQILKGAEKYPEPFNPASWTGEQLVNHGLQEARDLQVYLVGLQDHMERKEEQNKHIVSLWIKKFTEEEKKRYALEEENKTLKNYETEYRFTIEQLEKENGLLSGALQEVKEDRNCWKNDCKVLEKENKSLKDENRKLTEIIDLHELNGKDSVNVIERLEEESNSLKEELEKVKQDATNYEKRILRLKQTIEEYDLGIESRDLTYSKLLSEQAENIKLQEENRSLKEELALLKNHTSILESELGMNKEPDGK